MELAFLPDGRIIVIEQAGRVRLVVNGVLRTAPTPDITTRCIGRRRAGVIGINNRP